MEKDKKGMIKEIEEIRVEEEVTREESQNSGIEEDLRWGSIKDQVTDTAIEDILEAIIPGRKERRKSGKIDNNVIAM